MSSHRKKPSKTGCGWHKDPCKNYPVCFLCMTFDIQGARLFKSFTFVYMSRNWIERAQLSLVEFQNINGTIYKINHLNVGVGVWLV